VDWTAYRSAFEERASAIVGHPVRVSGTADATLLPVPSLTFTDVVIGEDAANPVMTVSQFDLTVELFPLLSGEVRVKEMRLDQPVATVRVAEDGTLEWLTDKAPTAVDPARVILDKVDIVNGEIRILDDRRPMPIEVTGINTQLFARSLYGPYKIDGAAVVEGEPVMLRIATGESDDAGRVAVKVAITPANRPVTITLDGQLAADGLTPTWAGKARVERLITDTDAGVTPWSLEGEAELDPARLLFKTLDFRYGPEDRPFSISGAATVDLGDMPVFDAVLSARQIDLDRTLGEGPDKPVAFEGVLAAITATLPTLPVPPIDGRIGFDIPGIVVAGSIVSEVRLDLTTAEDGWRVETLEANLPGRTTLIASGNLIVRDALAFEGSVAMSSAQPATLVAWWYPQRQKTLIEPFNARAQIMASSQGVKLSNFDATMKDSHVTGAVSFTPERSDRKPRISLALTADVIDVAQVQAIAGLAGGESGAAGFSSADVFVDFTASRVRAGDAEATGVDVAASLADGTLAIDRFAVKDLAGARLSAAGTIKDIGTKPDGSLQGRISAERFDGLAALVRGLAPGSRLAALVQTASGSLVPANLEATVSAKAGDAGTDAWVSVQGSAGGTSIDGSLALRGRVDAWREADLDLELGIQGPNGAKLMRQLGLDVPVSNEAGVGDLTVSAKGRPVDGLTGSARGRFGATTFSLAGTATLPVKGAAQAEMDASLQSADVGPILALTGNTMANILATTPVDVSAKVTITDGTAAVSNLAGLVDGEAVSGDLATDFKPAVPSVKGRLAVERASLEGLLELAFGPGTLAFPIVESRTPWPDAPFGTSPLDGFDADLALSIDRLEIAEALAADGVSLSLRSSPAGMAFDGVKAGFAGGELSGNLLLKQDLEGTAALSGTFKLDGASAEALAWRRNDRPVVTGNLSVDVELNGAGRTVAGLVASLSGGGSFAVTGGAIQSMNPRAFSAVTRVADAGQSLPDDKIRALFLDNIDVGDLNFDSMESTFTITGGTLRAPSIVVRGGAIETSGSGSVDLPRQTVESDWRLAAAADDAAATGGATPQVAILFRGPLAAPTRSVDVTAFSSYLGIRAFEKETERVLLMQADILERELLSRSVLRVKEEGDRRLRLEAEAKARVEAERIAAEEARQRALAPPEPPADGAGESDTFTDEILRELQANEPQAAPGTPLPQLPSVTVLPQPGGVGQGVAPPN
jgi:uncharacterized protein involved in outer membrane biogenesis